MLVAGFQHEFARQRAIFPDPKDAQKDEKVAEELD